jgi:biopolymer transport protein ExbD
MGMSVGDNKGGAMAEMNVVPLIDILLVLLIIFMVITPLTPNHPRTPPAHHLTSPRAGGEERARTRRVLQHSLVHQ